MTARQPYFYGNCMWNFSQYVIMIRVFQCFGEVEPVDAEERERRSRSADAVGAEGARWQGMES